MNYSLGHDHILVLTKPWRVFAQAADHAVYLKVVQYENLSSSRFDDDVTNYDVLSDPHDDQLSSTHWEFARFTIWVDLRQYRSKELVSS